MTIKKTHQTCIGTGIYIHIPFCKQACHYCDFHFSTALGKKEEMVNAIKRELFLRKDEIPNSKIETIYFGGGTPSLLSDKEISDLINEVYLHYKVGEKPEITLEANPDDLSKSKLLELKNSPVNRLSIGIQSFFEQDLKLMNRAHNADEAKQCLDEATKHFKNISIDLIYGIQGLSNQRWEENIDIALSYGLPHISSYALTVEPKTAMANFIKKGKMPDVSELQSEAQFYILVDKLEAEGFVNYEISNFGKPGFFSKNNTAYWQGRPYVGVGPSAHSYDGSNRGWNVANNQKYLKAIAEDQLPLQIENLSKTDKFNEYIMTGLRTVWGVSLNKITQEYGADYKEKLLEGSRIHIINQLLQLEEVPNKKDQKLSATRKGKFLIDGIASDLFILN